MSRNFIPLLLVLCAVQAWCFYYLWCCYNIWYGDIPERVIFAQERLFISPDLIALAFISFGILVTQVINLVLYKVKLTTRTWFVVSIVTPGLLGIIAFELFQLLAF